MYGHDLLCLLLHYQIFLCFTYAKVLTHKHTRTPWEKLRGRINAGLWWLALIEEKELWNIETSWPFLWLYTRLANKTHSHNIILTRIVYIKSLFSWKQYANGCRREKQTLQIIDYPCHVLVREWQFSLSCRVHADYSIRQKDVRRFTCGTVRLTFRLSHFPTSSLPLCPCVSVSDWVKYPLSEGCCLDWHENRPARQLHVTPDAPLDGGIRLWCTSNPLTRGVSKTEECTVHCGTKRPKVPNRWEITYNPGI